MVLNSYIHLEFRMAKSVTQSEIRRRIRREKRRKAMTLLFELFIVLLLSAAVSFVFFSSVLIQENSMNPTLASGDRVFVNRAAYLVTGIRRGDVIAYRSSNEIDAGIHVKRVIALPGETIQIRDGLILIDGKTYIENHEFPNISNPGIAENGVKLGADQYFVLGDNRNNSEDSRFADVGNILKSSVIGKVWFVGQPAKRAGFVR